MPNALSLTMDLVGDFAHSQSSEEAGEFFLAALGQWGATSLWARQFYLTPNWMDPKVSGAYATYDYARIRNPAWWGSQAQIYSDTVCPVSIGAARFVRPFFTSEVTEGQERAYGAYHEAMAEFGVRDTLAIPFFGPHNTAAGVTVWFGHREFSPDQVAALRLIGTMMLHQMQGLKDPLKPRKLSLSDRERDCLAFVAEGKSDWEISVILNISQWTAHQHVESAKKKLGVRTRAQAIAKHLAFAGAIC